MIAEGSIVYGFEWESGKWNMRQFVRTFCQDMCDFLGSLLECRVMLNLKEVPEATKKHVVSFDGMSSEQVRCHALRYVGSAV